MAFNLGFRQKKKVNIVLKDHVIRYLELTKNGDQLVVKNCHERYLPSGLIKEGKIIDKVTLKGILDECIEKWKIKKRDVQFIVPDQIVVIRRVQIPNNLEVDEIQAHLFMEIGTSIHLPFEDPIFEYHLLSSEQTTDKRDILLIAAPEEAVNEYRELLESVSLHPDVADISSLSFYRLYVEANDIEEDEHLLLIQFDLSSVNLTIFHKHYPMFSRHIVNEFDRDSWDINGDTITWKREFAEVESAIEEDLVEIERVMNFYRYTLTKGKDQITKVLIVGDHPHISSVFEMMKERFSLPMKTFNDRIITKEGGGTIPHEQYLTLGLALKEVHKDER